MKTREFPQPTAAIALSALRKTYAGGTVALHGIDLSVERGEFFGLLGPNGAGKSTLIGIICSLVNKTSGSVQVMGYDADRQREAVKACIGVVPQEFNFNNFERVGHIVETQAGYYGLAPDLARERTHKYLDRLGLWHKRDERARALSGGMKRRLMIARALVHEPPVLMLDEPTAGVDIELRRSMWDFLRELNGAGTTIVLTTHYLEEAEALCRRVAMINHGRLVADAPVGELLQELRWETFVLTVDAVPAALPAVEPCVLRPGASSNEIELDLPRGSDLTAVFSTLRQAGVQVLSLRNKANRLEEFFVKRVEAQRDGIR